MIRYDGKMILGIEFHRISIVFKCSRTKAMNFIMRSELLNYSDLLNWIKQLDVKQHVEREKKWSLDFRTTFDCIVELLN